MLDTFDCMYNGREWETKVTFNGNTAFDSKEIIDWNIVCEQDTSKIVGATLGKQLELTMLSEVATNLDGTLKLELGLIKDNNTHWFDMGSYWKVASIEQRDAQTVKITAYDPMCYLFEDKYLEGSYSQDITLADLVSHIQTKFGITIQGTIPDLQIMNPYGETYRDVISVIAMCSACNSYFANNEMKIKLVPLKPKTTPDLEISDDFYYNCSFDRSAFEVAKVTLDVGDNFGFQRGNGTQEETVALNCSFGNQLVCDNIYNNIVGYTCEGINAKVLGNPALEPFDTISLTDIYGNIHKIILNGYTMTFNGGFNIDIKTEIPKAENTTTNFVENKIRTAIKVEADKILSIVEADYQKKQATLSPRASRENIQIVLDEDMTPSKTQSIPVEFKVFKNSTTEELACVIKSCTASDSNILCEYANTSNILTINVDTNRVFTNEFGYIDIVLETIEGDIRKSIYWNTVVNTVENSILNLSATTTIFYRENAQDSFSPAYININAQCSRCELANWLYSTDGGSTFTKAVTGSNGLTISGSTLRIVNNSNLFLTTDNVVIKAEANDGTSDTITIQKIEDINNITVILDNESHIFNATSDGKAEATTLTINVLGYKGTTLEACTIGTITGLPTGMTSAINNNNTTSVNIKLTLTDSMVTKNGTITIPVTCDGVTINKKFSYSLSIPGKDGYSHNYNLVKNSAFLYGTNSWTFNPNVTLDNTKTFNGHPSCKTSQSGLTADYCRGCKNHNLPSNPTDFKKGETYTYSCYYYVEDKTSIDNGINLELKGKPLNSTDESVIVNLGVSLSNIIENNWTRISGTITLTEDYYNCYIYAFVRRNGTVWFTDFKLEEGSKLTKWVACPEDTETYVDNLVADLQGQIDGKIQTYSQNNDPSTSWTATEKANHEGDIWYNTDTKNTYRWNGTAWVLLQNAEAQSAKELAQTKAQVFTRTPVIPYYVGDLWITALDGTGIVKTCIKDRTSGSYTASEWVENLKYTDDTLAEQVQEELDNLSIGGRNLLRNSAGNLNNTRYWGNCTLDTSEISTKGWNSFKITRTNYASGNPRYQAAQNIPLGTLALKVGDYVTLSGWIYVSSQVALSSGRNNIALRNYADAEQTTFEDICDFGYNNVPKNTWTYFEVTSKATKDALGNPSLLISIDQNGLIKVTRLKLEKGNRATDWCPAIEEYKGSSVHIQPSTNIFKYSGSAYSPNTITLTPILTNSTYSKWQYSTNGGSSWTNVTSGSNGLTISNGILTISNTCSLYTSSVTSVAFKVIATGGEEISDVITIPRLKDGENSVNVILSNEAHSFDANYEGYAIAGSTTTSVLGYVGATQKAVTIGTISGLPTGMTAKINNNSTTSASVTFTVATTMTSRNGVVTIPCTCNGVTINKIFSYSLALDGSPASSCKITTNTTTFLSTDGGSTYSPNTITLTPTFTLCSFSKWQYLNNGTWTDITSGSNGFTIDSNKKLSVAISTPLFNNTENNVLNIKLVTNKTNVVDSISLYKLSQIDGISTELENMRSEIEQTNSAWKATFSTSSANNLIYDGDFNRAFEEIYWANKGGTTLSYKTLNAYPFYDDKQTLSVKFGTSSSSLQYSQDIELMPNTDYVYQCYIHTDNSVTTNNIQPLHFWIWEGDTATSTRLCTIVDYSQNLTVGRYNLCYVHFKTNDVQKALRGRFFMYTNGTSTSANLTFRQCGLYQNTMPIKWTPSSNEIITGITTIDHKGIKVEHSNVDTTTRMSADGFSIEDNNGDVLAWLSSKEQWTELKVDKVFANNIENVYTGDSYLYVDHSKTVAGDGTSSKPFNSFAQLSAYLQATPVINYDLYITVKDPGFVINEMLILNNLKGLGFIKITLEGQLVIANQGGSSCCMEFHQIDKFLWIVGSRELGSSTTGAVLRDGGDGNGYGIWATDVRRIEVDAITIACKNTGLLAERCHAYTWHCDFGKCDIAVELRYQSLYYTNDDVGSCSKFCVLRSGSFAYWGAGTTRPQGSVDKSNGMYYDGGVLLTATASPRYPSANPTPPSTSGQIFTYTYNCTSKQSYQYAWSNWSTDGSCKQGAWSHGLRGGHMFFNMTTIRAEMTGTIQDGNTITLTRANSGGISGDANVYINGSTCSSASGTPSYSNQTHLGTLKWGETKTFTLPKAIVQSLINGTCSSLAVYVNSTASNNYINITSASITLKTKK